MLENESVKKLSKAQGPAEHPPESGISETAPQMSNSDMLGLLGTERKLPNDVRGKMETSFNADFSNVRVYESSAIGDMGAQAFAKGNVIGFDRGKFDPGSESGQSLLGHELSHVVQQARGEVSTPMAKGLGVTENSALEARADHEGALAAKGLSAGGGGLTPLSPGMSAGAGLQLKADRHGMGKSERKAYDKKLKKLKGEQEKTEKRNIAANKESGSLRGDIDYTGLNQRQSENVADFETRLGQMGNIGSKGAQTTVLRDMYRSRAQQVSESSNTSMALSDLIAGEQMGSKAFRRADSEMTDIMGTQGVAQGDMLGLMDYLRRVSGKRDYDSNGNEIMGGAAKGRGLVLGEMQRRGMTQDIMRMNLDEAFMEEDHRTDDVVKYTNTLENGSVDKSGGRLTSRLHGKNGDLLRMLLTFGKSAGASPEERESSSQYNRGLANAMMSDNPEDANPYLEGITNDILTMEMPDMEPLASTPEAFSQNYSQLAAISKKLTSIQNLKTINPAYFEGLDDNKKRRLGALESYNAVFGSYVNAMLGSLGYSQATGYVGNEEATAGNSEMADNLRGMLVGKWKFKESDWA